MPETKDGGIMSLTVQNVSKTYGSFRAVDCLNFDFGQSGVFALLGTNGAGKTTSIRIILGMLSKDSGTVEWKGEPIRLKEKPRKKRNRLLV